MTPPTEEIFRRLRIGSALVVGYGVGQGLAHYMGHHYSEFFMAGFAVGVVATQGLYWLIKQSRRAG